MKNLEKNIRKLALELNNFSTKMKNLRPKNVSFLMSCTYLKHERNK